MLVLGRVLEKTQNQGIEFISGLKGFGPNTGFSRIFPPTKKSWKPMKLEKMRQKWVGPVSKKMGLRKEKKHWKLTYGIYKSPNWKGTSSSKPPFWDSMLIFGGVFVLFTLEWTKEQKIVDFCWVSMFIFLGYESFLVKSMAHWNNKHQWYCWWKKSCTTWDV